MMLRTENEDLFMLSGSEKPKKIITFYHDIEQDFDSKADPEDCRQIVKKFLEIEQRYGISANYNVVGRLYQEQPDLIDWIPPPW